MASDRNKSEKSNEMLENKELEKMKITVITVCFNAEKTIERTFESVLSQRDHQFEYIVVDGKSNDTTVEIIKKWKNKFEKLGIDYKWISEEDKGLYDAMNKGVLMASGSWIVYLNADDEFATENTIPFAKEKLDSKTDILYGDTIFISKNGAENYRSAMQIDTIKKHLPFIPQSAFVKKEVQKEFLFNLNYKIAADYDSFLRMYLSNKRFKQVKFCFSKFYEGGISNLNEWETYKEDINIKHVNGILNKNLPFQLAKNIRKYLILRMKL